jgi:uncharacterized protein (TIGR04255 family)
MNQITLGAWNHPPLAYVVAEAVIAPHYGIAAAIPRMQERLRATYPRTLEGTEVTIDPSTTPGVNQLWRMLSADQQRGIQLSSRAISLHSTRYVDAKEFLSAWDSVLEVVAQADLNAFVERVGLRYIDLIVPSEGRTTSDYVNAGVRGIAPPKEGKLANNLWVATFTCDGYAVSARLGAPAPAGMLLPPNFNAIPLQKPDVWVRAEQRLAAGQQIGFIDTDCSLEVKELFDATSIANTFRILKSYIRDTFGGLISQTAENEWK